MFQVLPSIIQHEVLVMVSGRIGASHRSRYENHILITTRGRRARGNN